MMSIEMMYKMFTHVFRVLIVCLLFCAAGCSSDNSHSISQEKPAESAAPQDQSPKLKEDADLSSDIVVGKWYPAGIIEDSEIKLFDEDQIDSNDRIVLLADGTFLYQNGEKRNLGPWAPIEVPGYDHTYLLSRKADSENSFMAFLPKADHNSLVLFEVGDNVEETQVLYVRENEDSQYIEKEQTAAVSTSSSSKTQSNHDSGSTSSGSSSRSCDGESYSAGSDWAKYDKNHDGCINDAEFQNGMNDAIEKRTSGSSSYSNKTDRTGLCQFKENGIYVCNKKAMSGYSFCKEHWDMMYEGYESFKNTYDQVTGNH